ncbi:MAG: hypothetical protein ABJB01_06175 [Rudaea sp.]
MPSSISSSDPHHNGADHVGASTVGPGLRLTASDRPGVAQPVPVRDIPIRPWKRIVLIAATLFVALLAGWEFYWRAQGAIPGFRNTDSLWSIQRRRIDNDQGDATVLVGASRMLFDLNLPTWERLAGRRPIQLSFEGTSPIAFMENLAADPNFTGRLLVGVTPDAFFSGFGRHLGALNYYPKESPAQRVGQWLSTHFVEPYLAFYDPDFALVTVLKRQPWPERSGRAWLTDVRKLSVMANDRDTHLWDKVENDADYRSLAQHVWAERFESPNDPPPAKIQENAQKQIDRAVAAAHTLRARGVDVIFVRMPSDGEYLAFENRRFPRAQTWDALIQRSGARGIHFADYPDLQNLNLPDWSHLSESDAVRFTEKLYGIVNDASVPSGIQP